MSVKNLFASIPADLAEELTEVLAARRDLRIERIVSRGHRSPDDFWYDQNESEWVLLISGRARLEFEPRGTVVELEEGDFLEIPAGTRHRVAWTDPARDTVWLAVFYPAAPSESEAQHPEASDPGGDP